MVWCAPSIPTSDPNNGFFIGQITPGSDSSGLGPLSSQTDQICTIHTVTRTFETVFSTFDIVTADDTGQDAFFTAIFESRFPEVNIAETSRGHIEAEFQRFAVTVPL